MVKNAQQYPKCYHIPEEVPHCTPSTPDGCGKHTPPCDVYSSKDFFVHQIKYRNILRTACLRQLLLFFFNLKTVKFFKLYSLIFSADQETELSLPDNPNQFSLPSPPLSALFSIKKLA